MLYKSLVKSHLEYAHSVWSPHKQYLIEEIEEVQKRATKLVLACKKLSYEQTLHEDHERLYEVAYFKILKI